MKTMKIFGPPGTGKTTTLISTLEKLLGRGYKPSEIAFLSHTKAAAEEARDRIALKFDGYSLREDFKWFRTIHSACCAVLQVGFGEIISSADLKKFSADTGWNVKGSVTMEDAMDGERSHDIILNARSMASHCLVPIEDIIERLPDDPALGSASRFLEDYDNFKRDIGKIDFIDMLEKADGYMLPVKVILVDECQDLSDRQWNIIHSFAANCDYLYLAGDDDQAIYEFMGSSKDGFLDHPADKQTVLDYSYRCAQSIGKASDNIIRRVERREEKKIDWQKKEGSVERTGIEISSLPWRDIAQGDKSVMVLFRHQKQCWNFINTLQDMGLPYTQKGFAMTTSSEAELVKIFLNMRNFGAKYTSAQIGQMMRKAGDAGAANQARKSAATPQSLLDKDDCPAFDWEVEDWPRMFAKYDSDRRRLNLLRKMVNAHGLDIIGTKPMIDVSTYHGSKGREADWVVLNTDCFKRTWDEQMRAPDTETRLCYVGLTRAKERAIILSPRTDMYMRALVEN